MSQDPSLPARRTGHPPSPRRQLPAQAAPKPRDPTQGLRAAVFAVAFIICAFFYWPAFELKKNLPDALYGLPVVLAGVVALADSWWSRRPFGQSLWIGGMLLPAVVFARVMFDVMQNPKSHNLWPFEIAIALGVGLPAALVGAALGWVLLRAAGRRSAQ